MKLDVNQVFIGLSGALASLAGVTVGLIFGNYINVLSGIQALGTLAVAFSAAVAYRLYKANVARHEQEDSRNQSQLFLNEAITLLERAYEVFSDSVTGLPENNRLMWLSVARMLLRYERLKSIITSIDHIEIIREHEEYHRLRFYTLIDSYRGDLTLEYFQAVGPDGARGNEIDTVSVAVIFQFIRWPDDQNDPLNDVDEVGILASGAIPVNYIGVHNYIGQYQALWEAIQERRAQTNSTDE